MKSVVVLLGGWSAEREVSLVSGRACAGALREAGYHVREVDLKRDLAAFLAALEPPPDVVFNALHGRWGEDGRVQAMLDILGIPYTHSGVLASALAMHKPMAKHLFAEAGIRCPDGITLRVEQVRAADPLPRPYVVKPLEEGSSVGVHIVRGGDNAPALGTGRWEYGETVLVEPFIEGRELTVAVMEDRALGVTELKPHRGFYDYEAKYTAGRTEHLVPAPIHPDIAAQAMEWAVRAHRALGCRGISRADYRYDDTGGEPGVLYMLEVNTQPGMTPLSLVPEQAAHAGIAFVDLVRWMVEHATCDS